MSKPTRPVLQYFGGKWRIADWVISHFPEHQCYVEPFGGAASVLMKKEPAPLEVYNDIDQRVVTLFRVLRDPEMAERLRQSVSLTPYSRKEYEDCRTIEGDPVEIARRLIVRSFQAIGKKEPTKVNGWRCATPKDVRSACGTWNNWPDQIPAFTERMKQVQIDCRHWHDVIRMFDSPSTLFYLDPPYPLETRIGGKGYANELSDADHAAICETIKGLQGYCVLSTYPNSIYSTLLEGWEVDSRSAQAQSNEARTEALYLCPRTQQSLRERSAA